MKSRLLFEALNCKNFLFVMIVLSSITFGRNLSYAQNTNQQKISGTVIGKNGESLVGVTVTVKGTTAGSITDEDGKFSIQVEPGQIIVFSYLGYQTKEVKYEGHKNITVELLASSTRLNEIVAIGYATKKKSDVTSAISTINGNNLTKRTTSNIEQSLQGKVPGLTIQDFGAGPGESSMTMRIRGLTTLGDNEPLVIVDGIEQPIEYLNPEDIESISVLKDASAAAIYGSRAAKGVILVTTKRPDSGKLSVSYSGYYALQKTNNNPVHMGLKDYLELQQTAWLNSTGSPNRFTDEYIDKYLNATDRLKYPLPNIWYETMLHTAPQISNSISLNAGNETVEARISLRHQYQDGIINNSNAKIYEIRANTDYNISSKIKLSTDINYRYRDLLSPINESAVFEHMLQNSEWTVPRYPDGTYGVSSDGKSPLVDDELAGTKKTKINNFVGNIKAKLEIIKGLDYTIQLGILKRSTYGKNYTNSYEIRDYYDSTKVLVSQPINRLTEIRNNMMQLTLNNTLNYGTSIGENNFNILVGYSQIENKTHNLSAYRQGFYNNDLQSISQGSNDNTKDNGGFDRGWGLRSYFSRLNYNYSDKYLFEATARYDGSSRFTGNKKYSMFPSFSAAWRISEEPFWKDFTSVISDLKLRSAWGEAGNQAVDLYSYLETLDLVTYSFDGSPVPGYGQNKMVNKNLGWETTKELDFGLETELLQGRISLAIDYYAKKTEGILLTLPVPGTFGLDPAPQNAGRVDNKGWEFSVGSRNKFGKFWINANLNLSINNNVVKDLAGTGPYITGNNETRYITGIGYSINSLWGYRTDGLFQTKEEIESYPTMRSGVQPGDVKFLDLNGDGQITADDMTFLGRSFPKYSYGGNINLSYSNFRLDILFQGVSVVRARVGGAIIEMGIWEGFTSDNITGNYWTPENRDARFPRPLKYDLRNIVMSDRDLENGSYFRIKNVRLNYKIPKVITKKLNISNASIYLSKTNVLTFADLNEWGVDPETVIGGRTQAYPQTSLTTLGLNINF